MHERRKFWQVEYALRFVDIALLIAALLILVIFYAVVKTISEPQYTLSWRFNLVILLFSFVGTVLVFFTALFVLMHRSLGPLARTEAILEKAIRGDYSQRITLRNKDVMAGFFKKVNRLIELLEEKSGH